MKDKISDAVMKCDWGSEKSGKVSILWCESSEKSFKHKLQMGIKFTKSKLSSSEPTYKLNSTLGRSFVYLTQLLAKMGKFDIQSINQIMVLANQSQMDNVSIP